MDKTLRVQPKSKMMKTLLSQNLLFLLACSLCLIIQGCEKVPEDDCTNSSPSTPTEKRILQFLDGIERHTLKSSVLYDKSEGIWLLEASANYVYVNPEEKGSDFMKGRADFPVHLENDKLSGTALAELYTQISDTLYTSLAEYALDNPYLEYLDFSWTESNGQEYLRMDFAFGGGSHPINPAGSFTAEDWWWYGLGMGQCNGAVCCAGKDAATQMMWKATYNISYPFGHAYFTDIDAVLINNPVDLPANHPNPNYCYFPTFYNTSQPPYDINFHTCLSPFEMNYHFNQILDMIPVYRPFIDPSDPGLGRKDFAGLIIIPISTSNANGYQVIDHMTLLLYGISNASSQTTPYAW